MALEVVGGAFLSASLQLLFDRMASKQVVDFVREKNVDDELLNKLKIKLSSINKVLDDAEKKQLADPAVRKWLNELKHTVYNTEDLVYEIHTEALRCEIEGKPHLLSFFSTRSYAKQINQRIAKILDTLEYIVQQKDLIGLKEVGRVENKSSPRVSIIVPPLEDESGIHGRDADKEAIVNLLLSVTGTVNKISVIPIVGMGGLGKTTLAKLAYNDFRVNNLFDIKMWITVSDEFDVFMLTKTILEKVTSRTCSIEDQYDLQLKLKEVLEGKKFLLVLDDVWNENYDRWYALRSPLEFAACGSKIIVTTRSESIGSMMGNVPNHRLQVISDEDGWKLFAKHVFSNNNVEPSKYSDLEVIGKKIVEKCQGLPLAIISLGGLLRSKLNSKEWEKILKNDIWELIDEKKCDILPALWLSYYYLPPNLKRCFAYCSIFPKDVRFEKENIILLWMAEDLLQPQKYKTLEEVGDEYFSDLVSRSFFQCDDNYFIMHDLVNDLASFVSGEFCLRLDDNDSKVVSSNARHLSCMGYGRRIKNLEALSENKLWRTLLPNRLESLDFEPMQTMQCLRVLRCRPISPLPDSIGNLKLLRYLDLRSSRVETIPDTVCTLYNLQTLILIGCYQFRCLPNSIGNLKNLRYLDLSRTAVKQLPETICNLPDLRTLSLSYCPWLRRLPKSMARLTNLRHINIEGTYLEEMPPQMSALKFLEKLSYFIVGKDSGSSIEELEKLSNLRGSLGIKRLENIVNVEDVSVANALMDKKYLTRLSLEWDNDVDDSHKAKRLLERLEPRINVEELAIANYGGTSFPDWVGRDLFFRLGIMKLKNCRNCYSLPPLGQLPSLKELCVKGFDMVERVGHEFYCGGSSNSMTRPFKSLEFLKFSDMSSWEEWLLMEGEQEDGAFPKLRQLELKNCPKLSAACLPDCLPSLNTLDISGCKMLLASLQGDQLPTLEVLALSSCPEVESFPEGRLPSNIHTIRISRCRKLVSLLEEGWPSNLKSLSIWGCSDLFNINMPWNLGMLTSLTSLTIGGQNVALVSFLEEGRLPITLTSLNLLFIDNLRSLHSKAFRSLTSLKKLKIYKCTHLQCLPEEGLPASLELLSIESCPLVAQRCQREKGEDWPKIAHIPRIRIVDRVIYDDMY
ncbi:putative disease resistance RPP13-like protein 1 [Ziziphus jujuba]|uniref:Disease resistance RPP13-like protein 1 n=1 Tax=Ziziphus jujuba TaxID=326968 RepID=A0ABM4A6W0_ZIZJJ|nr:putative disease resistance RPP13-like protein 1 [Ziziphus jujuba]XP_060672469.1 putative disease resistance RPP13-like protein 1 [Ziziphus jujuba]XP_060672470.1 putative disease resistance RPP13-like protein 1 [Ziziphus jujuba]XP_060672471.1 putative disease resistance RPP13-like protein 1 [Ziziphus jujuba]